MKCPGLHCPGCSSRSGGVGVGLAVVVGAVVAERVAPAVQHAVEVFVHAVWLVLVGVMVTLAALFGLGLLAGAVWVGRRLYRWRAVQLQNKPLQVVAVRSSEAVERVPRFRLLSLPAGWLPVARPEAGRCLGRLERQAKGGRGGQLVPVGRWSRSRTTDNERGLLILSLSFPSWSVHSLVRKTVPSVNRQGQSAPEYRKR